MSHFDQPNINSACDFRQLRTSIANISGTDGDVDKRKTTLSTTIPPAFDEKDLVNFGLLTTKWINAIAFGPRDVARSGISTA